MIIYILNKIYADMVFKVLSKMGNLWNAKEIYQQGRHLYDFKEGIKFAANN